MEGGKEGERRRADKLMEKDGKKSHRERERERERGMEGGMEGERRRADKLMEKDGKRATDSNSQRQRGTKAHMAYFVEYDEHANSPVPPDKASNLMFSFNSGSLPCSLLVGSQQHFAVRMNLLHSGQSLEKVLSNTKNIKIINHKITGSVTKSVRL